MIAAQLGRFDDGAGDELRSLSKRRNSSTAGSASAHGSWTNRSRFHPLGPTGTGQIVEVTRQLRGEAGVRQQLGARHGLAHMVGIGAVCVMHVLEREGS